MLSLLIGLGVVAVAFVGGLVAVRAGAKSASQPRLTSGNNLSMEQAQTLKQAKADIQAARNVAYKISQLDLRGIALSTLDKAEKVVEEMKNQPEEIRRAYQFFSYYVPTIKVVLEKYFSLDSSGNAGEDKKQKAQAYLEKMSEAFDQQYEALFKDEALDFSVEIEAMEMALKRDGF